MRHVARRPTLSRDV
eukprot:g6735.t1